MENEKDKANYKSDAYSYMNQEWQKTQEVFGGVRQMRESAHKYLTQFRKEEDDDYTARKNSTEFYNVFKGNVCGIVGTVLNSDVIPQDAPLPIKELFTDINLLGDDLEMFLRESFTNAVRDGHSFIFVDAPPPIKKADGTKPTLADVQDRQPFWVNYKANQAINWQFEKVGSKSVLSQITFKECTKEIDGTYGEKEVIRYRVLKRGSYSLYREETDVNTKKIVLHAEIEDEPTNTPEITVAVVYGQKTVPLESIPPLAELLDINLSHYNKYSQLNTALEYIIPMPVFKFDSEDDAKKWQKLKMTVAANRGVVGWGEHFDVKYLELQGASIESLEKFIADKERRMAKLGIEKFAPIDDAGIKTAYEVGSDNRQEMSEVSVMAYNLETAVEQAFYFTAELINAIKGQNTVKLGEAEKAGLKLRIDYDKLVFSVEKWQLFSSMVDTNKLSLQTFLEWLQMMSDMPKGFSPEQELERIAKEKAQKQKEMLAMQPIQQG